MKNNGQMDFLMGGNAVSMNVDKLSEVEKAQAVKTFNDATIEAGNSFKDNIEKELAQSRKIKEDAANLEIMPTSVYVLARLYDKNPYEQIKLTESGIMIPAYDGMEFSKEEGTKVKQDLAVRYAEVLAVGPEVKYIKPGDDIIFRNHVQLPAPFLGQDLWVIGQSNILVVINEGLQKRFDNISNM